MAIPANKRAPLLKESKIIELCALWDRGEGRMKSAPIMDDRLQELLAMAQEGPVKLYVKPNPYRTSEKAPHAFLLAMPASKRRG
jgi:hypothetical protein